MRILLGWLVIVCMVVGMNARGGVAVCAGPATCCETVTAGDFQPDSECCTGATCAPESTEKHQEGDGCPTDHHHHHHACCSHGLAVGAEISDPCRLGIPDSVRTGIRHQGETLPEDPFLSSEKPPLI